MSDHLTCLCNNNREYFNKDKSENGIKFHLSSSKIAVLLEKYSPLVKEIQSFAGDYDFDENTPGNGYRSFLFIFNAAIKYTENACKYIVENRGKFLFRKSANAK
jgi:hormone-sensitive lipase